MNDLAMGLGRVLLALIFILAGFNKLMAIAGTTTYLARLGVPSPHLMVYAVIAIEVVGGLMIAAGLFTRPLALLFVVHTAIATYLAHKFWAVPADQYTNQFNHFFKNIAIIGGFLVLAGVGPGRYSLRAG